jgi:ectoine hydroxylase-related dioxygenase (phytanoyl-CoA dioxygenase family)
MIRIDCRGVSPEAAAASEQTRTAIACFVKHGYAILDHVVSAEKIRALQLEFDQHYGRFLRDEESDDSKKVGAARYMIPLRFARGFADTAIFANPYVIAVVREVLEQQAIIEAYGAVVSLPGASAQPPHYDAPHLFGAEISALLPAHALTFALPLVEMNELHGTTTLKPGSHRWRKENMDVEGISPTIPIGSCVMWDFRLVHSGTANQSTLPRPMVYCTYSRPWYQDPVNFRRKNMRRVDFDAGFLETLPEDTRRLLKHVA